MKEQLEIDIQDMWKAYLDCRKHKLNKISHKKFEVNALRNVCRIVQEINSREYELLPSECFIITRPTYREVFCAQFRDRVVQHFIYNELMPVIDKKLIFDTTSCRIGKGADFAIERVYRFIRMETNNYTETAHCLKMDLSGFFMHIDRKLLWEKLKFVIINEYQGKYTHVLLYLVDIILTADYTKDAIRLSPKEYWDKLPQRKTLFGNKNGLSIGNICSQLFANYYLNDFDHILKSRHRCISRYVDDIIVVDKAKNKLIETLDWVREYLPTINMSLSENKTKISNCDYGIHYLGVVIKPYHIKLGKSRINRVYESVNNYNDDLERKCQSFSSRKGMMKRYHGRNILHRVYNNKFRKEWKDKIKLEDNYKFTYLDKIDTQV